MTKESDLAAILRERCERVGDKGKVVAIHLFGIEFAEALDGRNLKALCDAASVQASYATEIRKEVRLAEHVTLRRG